MRLNRSLILAIILVAAILGSWEYYTRSMGYIAALNDDKALWAVERSKVDKLGPEGVVILGSSRAHFDIQLDVWEEETGQRPIMLASDGCTPTPAFIDIIQNSSFNGTLLIGVTPGLLFSAPFPQVPPWNRITTRVDHFHDRTYAQQMNHVLSIPLERTFAFLNSSEENWADDIDLRSMLSRIRIGERTGPAFPPFYNFSSVDIHRNTTMFEKTSADTAFARSIKDVWLSFIVDAPPPATDTMLLLYESLVQEFTAKGGKVIFIRFPSSGQFREIENEHLNRTDLWDPLIARTEMPGIHFEDYPSLQGYNIPEWSHIATPDARLFTKELITILNKQQLIRTETNP